MDTDLAKELSDLNASLSRIDERTIAIHDAQKDLADTLKSHEDQNREDFTTVHGRVSRVEKKQSWILGVGSAVVGIVIFASGILTKIFGGS